MTFTFSKLRSKIHSFRHHRHHGSDQPPTYRESQQHNPLANSLSDESSSESLPTYREAILDSSISTCLPQSTPEKDPSSTFQSQPGSGNNQENPSLNHLIPLIIQPPEEYNLTTFALQQSTAGYGTRRRIHPRNASDLGHDSEYELFYGTGTGYWFPGYAEAYCRDGHVAGQHVL
ncbi:unnamed protein product [Ambrosiozyma monospora]|uniref:Unnamed protein product n=1 Tax=Ambrosiozyma monospora TaxID=43982 RepID=A0ACB5T8I9_AMBMO|nr:unnamed protein product [Ambrosiozyma monospora]